MALLIRLTTAAAVIPNCYAISGRRVISTQLPNLLLLLALLTENLRLRPFVHCVVAFL